MSDSWVQLLNGLDDCACQNAPPMSPDARLSGSDDIPADQWASMTSSKGAGAVVALVALVGLGLWANRRSSGRRGLLRQLSR